MSFKAAADAMKASGNEPGIKGITNDEKLALYGLYKQGTEGDNKNGAPGFIQFEAKAKHAAWLAHTGKSQEAAQNEYIELAKTLLTKYGLPKYIVGF